MARFDSPHTTNKSTSLSITVTNVCLSARYWKFIADICFLLSSYVSDGFASHVKITAQGQGHFGGYKVTLSRVVIFRL